MGLDKLLPTLKKEKTFLKETNSQSLQGMTKHVDAAFVRFFRENNGFPKFKSKKNPIQSFPVPQHYTVDFENSIVKLPKLGKVETIFHRMFEGTLRTATISRSCTGKYYISILVENDKELPMKQKYNETTTVGVDVGIKYFAVLSTGEKIENPKYLKDSLKRLKCLQKRVSRKQKGSNRRNKTRLLLSKIQEKISNQRNNFQHQISSKLSARTKL